MPVVKVAGEAIRPSKVRLLALTEENDKLLTEQGILQEELGFAAWQVNGHGQYDRATRQLGRVQESPFPG